MTTEEWDFESLVETSKAVDLRAIAASTQTMYATCLKMYALRLSEMKNPSTPYPLTVEKIRAFVMYVGKRYDYGYSYLRNFKAAFTYWARTNDHFDVTVEMREFWKGLKNEMIGDFLPKAVKPITITQMEEMAKMCVLGTFREIQMMTLFSVMFYGFLRIGEALALTWEDIKLTEEGGVTIFIKKSKADQTGHGDTVHISSSENPPLYHPSSWVRRLQKYEHSRPFIVSPNCVRDNLKDLLRRMMVVDRISTHSFRKGGAHAAALAGIQDCMIKRHGRWKSAVYQRYTAVQMSTAGTTITKVL